ncbi:hypothetical protein HAX54_036498, partial [Datura stramonium]|nr:hypothetical protein [Datura stramonium]
FIEWYVPKLHSPLQKEGKMVVKLDASDYKNTAEYWSTTLIRYVLGDNPYEASM